MQLTDDPLRPLPMTPREVKDLVRRVKAKDTPQSRAGLANARKRWGLT